MANDKDNGRNVNSMFLTAELEEHKAKVNIDTLTNYVVLKLPSHASLLQVAATRNNHDQAQSKLNLI